jgi:large subunit ribosomal protein L7/L12
LPLTLNSTEKEGGAEMTKEKDRPPEAKKAEEPKGTKAEVKAAKPEKEEEKSAAKPSVELSKTAQKIIDDIEKMPVLELANLVKALEDKFGVSAAMPVAAAGAAAGAAAAGAAPAEEKTTFSVVLAKIGAQKIQVIKEVRALTNLGLKEAKDLVESAPKPIKEDVPKEEAEEIKKKIEAVGATVELK